MSTGETTQPPETNDEGHHEPDAPAPSRRALRTMAVVRWVLLGLVTALAGYTVWTFWGPKQDGHAAHEEARYY